MWYKRCVALSLELVFTVSNSYDRFFRQSVMRSGVSGGRIDGLSMQVPCLDPVREDVRVAATAFTMPPAFRQQCIVCACKDAAVL